MSTEREHGEGNYETSRRYRERVERFVKDGRVGEAAGAAAPRSPEEARALEEAEAEGRARAAEEDREAKQDGR